MSDSIKVAIKVRPLIKREINEKLPIQWTVQGNSITPVDPELRKRGEGVFYFDHIFDMSQTNNDLFDVMAKPIIDAAINGVNGTIFAYGQTSSGKTYSMMGSDESPGVIPLAVNYIFDTIDNTYCREFLLRVSYLEIYNERVNDLLDKNRTDLKIKEDAKTRQVLVDCCKEDVCNTPEKVLEAMKSGDRNRRTGETNMNERSSRSHTIFRITIESRESNASEGAAVHVSQLNLVDLAGSERARQTGATGERFNEGRHINLSLSSLGLVIMQLSECQENPQKFINFRDSKLTRILQASLGGNAMTAIICAITPAALEETQCTLAFASRAKRIKNKPQVNEVLSDEALLKRYRKQMAKLNAELERLKSTDVEKMESELMEKERSNQILAERLELLKKSIVCGNSSSEAESFKSKAKRRRTWGGSRTLSSKSSPVFNVVGLPTIKELEKTPEKIKKKEKMKRRQSIFQTIDFHNQTFQTEFTDFELELIESERARNEIDERCSGGSSVCDEDYFITRRGKSAGTGRNVQFRDDVSFMGGSFKSVEETPQRKTPEPPECEDAIVQAELPSPGTPKPLLRSRVSFLMEQYNALRKDHSYLEEFAKLEKQMFVDDAVKLAMAEHDKILAATEQKCREINEKYAKLESHSAASDKRLAELEQQLAESASSFKALKRENQDLIDSLNKTKSSKPVVEPQATNSEKETSSIFANASYFEEMDVSDVQSDSMMMINDTQDTSLGILTTSKLDESKKSKELSNTAYSEFIKQIGEKSSDELVSVMQELINSKLSLEEDNTNLQSMLQRKAREADDIKNDIRELKSGIEKLQETIHLLTAENTDLTSKLTNEKEHAKEAQQSLQTTISELNSTLDAVTQEKTLLATRVNDLDEQLQTSSKNMPSSVEELRNVIKKCKETIATLTAENEELSSNLMSKIEELDRVKDAKAPPGEHECAYRELSINLSDRNKLLEVENIELSNSLMEKIEEYDSVKEELDKIKSKTSSIAAQTESAKLIEITENFESIVNTKNNKSPSQTVDDLLRLSIGANTSPLQSLGKSHENGHALALPLIATNGSIFNSSEPKSAQTTKENEDLSQIPLANPWESIKDHQENDENVDAWKIKAEMLQEQVNQLNILNSKLSELKITSCTECAHLAELNENRKSLKLEAKALNRKLRELQEKFDQECADSALLRTKANEDLNLSVCDLTMNGSMMMECNLNISFVEEKVQALHHELEALRDKHDKLSDLYKEKCDEIDKLQDACSRETTPTPTSTDSPRVKRSDGKLNRIQTEMDKLRNDFRVFKKNIAGISAALQKFVSEKAIMQAEIETLRAEKASNFTGRQDLEKAEERIAFLENEVSKLGQEIQNSNLIAQQLEKAKISLEAQVEALKAEKVNFGQNGALSSASSSSSDQERIETLENHVTRLCEEINSSNALKRQLEDTKASLEAQVQSLQTEKATFGDGALERGDVTTEKIKFLENEVARLGEEICKGNADREEMAKAKSSLEAEVQSLKTEKASMEEKMENTEDVVKEEKIRFLENQVALLGEEISKTNAEKEELVNAKSSLEAEVETLKSEKVSMEEKMENTEDVVKEEKIRFLENQVALLGEEISKANAEKEELVSSKSSLEAEVEALKGGKVSMEEKTENTEDVAKEEKIKFLENQVALLGEEISKANAEKEELVSEKSSLEAEVETLKAGKVSMEEKPENTEDVAKEEKIRFLENQVALLGDEISKANAEKEELVSAKSSLEAEVASLKDGKVSMGENMENPEDVAKEEKIRFLENQVALLGEEIIKSNAEKEELVSAKSSLEAEVEFLKAEKVSMGENMENTEDIAKEEKIRSLQNQVALLGEEISKANAEKEELVSAKSSLEAEVESLKTEKVYMGEKMENTEDFAKEEKIKSLEHQVALLGEEISKANAEKEELVSAKSSLESEVVSLKAEKALMEEKMKNTEDIATEENIQFLQTEVARLSEEIRTSNTLKEELEGVKSALESEVELLKVEKSHEKNTTAAKEISMDEKMQHLKNEVAHLKTHNAKLFALKNVESSLETEEEYFAAEKASFEKSIGIEDDSMTRETMKYLENEVSRLSEEINNSNVVKEELVSTKSSLEAEVQSLKAEKVAFDEKVTQTDGTSAQERINLLENEVARLNDEIIHSNEVKEELESAKSSLEAEVQYLKVEKASNEAENASTEQERIAVLETELIRLSDEIDGSTVLNRQVETIKSSLEAEIETLKAENKIREESMNDLLKSLQNLESTNSTLKIALEQVTSEKDQLVEKVATISQVCDFPNNNDQDFAKIVASLELKLKETDQELDKYMQINQELNNRLTAIKASEENLNSVKSQLEDQIKDLQKERTDNEAHLENLRESLKRLEENNASTISRLEDVEASLEESQKENTDLTDKLRLSEKSEEELTNAKLEITNLKAEITSLEENLVESRSTISDLQESNCRLQSELEKAEIEKEKDSDKEIEEASYETLKEYEKMVEELRTKVQDITNNLHANTKETADLNEQLTKLNSAKNELNDARSALESQVTILKTERDDLEASLIDLRKTLNELGEKNSCLNEELQMLRTEKQKCSEIVTENLVNPKLEEYEKTINKMNSRVKELTAELNKFATENEELNLQIAKLRETLEKANTEEQKFAVTEKSSGSTKSTPDKYSEELESARTCITKEIKSLKPATENNEFADKSISELFALFVHTIMSKEQEIIKALSDRFEREKRKLEEQNRQSCDAEKRATIWAKELEAEVERTQQDLIRQESKTSEFTNEIAKLQNLLKESAHENQLLNEKMQVLELDFNTLQAELEKYPEAKHNVTLNSTQDKERLIQEALQTREMELSAKLRLVEKQSKEKLQELTKSLEFYKTKNLELANNLEGLDANERQLKSIADMKSNELIKANNTIENLRGELDVLTENFNQLTQQHTEATRQIDEITSVLKTKCDKLSEYKTKLETITPEYEHLKDQAAERQLKLEKYKSEIECMTTENEKQISSLKDCLDSAEIKSAGYRKQVADLTNRNTVLQTELTELQTKFEELERTNAKLTKSMRNSTSKIRAAEEMEDLKDQNRTLQRNLDGASNRIADLQEMKTQMLKEVVELQSKYEVVSNENTELKSALSSHKASVNQLIELRTKYELLLQEKNRIALELEDKKATLLQLENKHKDRAKEIEELKTTNKDLDEEMDDMLKKIEELRSENFELVDKLYKIECEGSLEGTKESKDQIEKMQKEIEELKAQRDQTRGELLQLENKHKECAQEIEALKTTNKDLDEEMDDMVSKIEELKSEKYELAEKLYTIESSGSLGDTKEFRDRIERMQTEIEDLKSQRNQIRGELESATKTLESFRNENSELRIKVGHLDRGDSLSCDSSRSASPALEAVRVDNRRRRSRTELFNQKRQLEIFDTNETNCCGTCRCATLQEEVCKLERELVTKNGQIATLEIRIQSENFPHMKRSKDLEELYASSRRKCKLLEAELQKIRDMKLSELSSECDKCRHWRSNKRDQSTQCLPGSEKLYLSGMSSGIVEDHIKMEKLQKTNDRLKEICRGRHKVVQDLQSRIKELEKQLNISTNEDDKSVPTGASALSASSKTDFAANSRQAMKENVPTIWVNQRPSTQPRREWFT